MKINYSFLLIMFLSLKLSSQVLWGTYYGTGSELPYRSAYDNLNNVMYITGQNSSGAYWVKFNTAGGFINSGTFGSGTSIIPHGITVDIAGNFYIMGYTNAAATGIATGGAHQTSYGGGNYDCFLVKYNSSGVIQWSTYYGGTNDDGIWGGVVTDNSGNVYMGSTTRSTNGISQTGFQMTNGGNTDGFLVKFNSTGVRQWATYYGGSTTDYVYDVAIDGLGNPYIAGYANSTTSIATAASHQSVYIGTGDCPFLAKFDPSGNRLWGTYYGGSGRATAITCDVNNDLFVCGWTDGSGPYGFNGYQNTSAGSRDGFVAKFNSSGVRQWGTFVGAAGSDECMGIKIDLNDNVFIAGLTSSSSGFALSGPQMVYGGGSQDAFLAKLNSTGSTLIYNTYKGGTAMDLGMDVKIDNSNKVYLYGLTQSATNIALSGYDNTLTGSLNAFFVKYDNLCASPSQPSSISGSNSICAGVGSTTYSIAPVATATSYAWSLPSGWSGTSATNTISATAGSSGIFTVTANNACGASSQQTMAVTVNPLPTLTVNSGSICSGNSFTMVASGASTYTFSSGPVVTPTITSSYSVTGTSSLGCISSLAAISNITVNPLPSIAASSSTNQLCIGSSATLSASGGSSYTWNPGGTGTTIVINPTVSITYTLSGTDVNGCNNHTSLTQTVVNCGTSGLLSMAITRADITVYPNPFSNKINIISNGSKELVEIFNAIGSVIYSSITHSEKTEIDMNNQSNGIYFIRIGSITKKIIKD